MKLFYKLVNARLKKLLCKLLLKQKKLWARRFCFIKAENEYASIAHF